jgi:hypothetical protein
MQQITVFINLQDQLKMFRTKFVHHQERKTANYSMWYVVLLWWWVGGQEGGSVVLCAWCEGRYLTANPPPQQDTIPLAVICSLTLLMMDIVLSETF